MQKVYVVIQEYLDEYGDTYTDIIHVCDSLDLAVEKSNEFIQDAIRDYMEDCNDGFDFSNKGRYFSKDELFDENGLGVEYLTSDQHPALRTGELIKEYYSLRIEEYEVKGD
jgi:hypothetical protein